MTSSDLWDAETAEHYDESSAFMFAPDVLEPVVGFLADWQATVPRWSSRSVLGGWRSPWSSVVSR